MQALQKLARFARKSPRDQWQSVRAKVDYRLIERGWKVPRLGNDRTAYVVGLYGAGRHYINGLMLKNIPERAKYFRDVISFRFHAGPSSMIYSGHATIKHDCYGHVLPAVTSRILEAVRSRYADLIFIYRHPLDSLLTNWIWLRTFHRDKSMISGISQLYKNTDDLCAELERNYLEFKAFTEGAPNLFTPRPGPRFLSFPEFVEETELYLGSATLALRLEDFTIDPLKEFTKIVEVMSADPNVNRLPLAVPATEPYRYLAVKEKVPRFRSFINALDAETRRRIGRIGYDAGV